MIGWATVNADGVNGTTGGANGPTVEIRSAADLKTYGEDNTARVLRLTTNISGQFSIGSNKTLIGATNQITLTGGISVVGKQGAELSNVIVKNLRINGSSAAEDGMVLRYTHHVWVDHCEFFDGPDGNLDIVRGSSYVTVSWTKFYYTANYKALPEEVDDPQHRFSNLIGNGDEVTADAGKLKVTFHHNWWAQGVLERMPFARYGDIHQFNNYFSSKGNIYAIGVGFKARFLVENNVFEDVKDPHKWNNDQGTGQILVRGNEYINTTGLKVEGQGNAFVPPYAYTPEPVASVKATVMANVGPR